MKEIWIGKRVISGIRECCLLDNKTMEEIHFLVTEEEARQKCGDIPVRFTVNYEKERIFEIGGQNVKSNIKE